MDGVRQVPAEVVLIPRRRGNLVEYATPSVYSGGSAAASSHPSQHAPEDNDLREAIADKDLLIMELREEKAQLQMDSSQAEGSWQAALQHKDRAIQQLSAALQSKEQALTAMSQRDAAIQRSPAQNAQEQRAHEHDMDLLRSQLAEHNATIAALRARLTQDSQPPHASDTPAPSRRVSHTSAATATQRDPPAQPGSASLRHAASRSDLRRDTRTSGSAMSVVRQDGLGSGAAFDVDLARMGARHGTEQSTPRSRMSDAENLRAARPPLQPVADASGLATEATFHPDHAPEPAFTTPRAPPRTTVSTLRHELLANIRRAQEAVGQLPHEGRRGEARLQGLLREQEALLQGLAEDWADDGFGERFRSVLEERLREASTRAHILSMENEELEARLAAAQDSCGELRAALQERDSTALEQQLEADALRARLADGAVARTPGHPRKGAEEGHLSEQLRRLQQRLVSRDAAAKKYKEGCRSLKERVEDVEQVCKKLKQRNEELARGAQSAPLATQDQEREARELVAKAQRDVEHSRAQAAQANTEKRKIQEQVGELQKELRAALAAQEAAGQRAEEKVEEERGRAARALRQRTEELDWRSAEREAEAEAALTRAEKLRQAATDCEAAATRKVEAANEATRIAETRLAEAREEASRLQQRLMAAEEAAGRDARKLETLARDVRAEQQHTEATLERLERAHARVQQLEGQVAAADDAVSRYKEEKREVAATLEDLKFRVSQAERRGKQEVLSSAKLQERVQEAGARAAHAEARLEDAWQAAAAQEAAARSAEARLEEAEAALHAADMRCKELSGALQRSDAEQAHLRETLVRTEALIKQAKQEHEQDLHEAAAAAHADADTLRRQAHDLQLAVERERAARERSDASVQEAQAALEQHRASIEQSHAQSLKAAGSLQSMKERFKAKQAEVAARDATIRELRSTLSQVQARYEQQLAAKDEALRRRELEAAELAETEGQLRAAQARLAQVAPIMRRIAAHGTAARPGA